VVPSLLFVSDPEHASHRSELISACSHLHPDAVISGSNIRKSETLEKIARENIDYLICIHYPYIIPPEILQLPKEGVINLHPAYLPFNRGWNTPTWAIVENTPFGATLHFMEEAIDIGDIILQKELKIDIADTADTLYKKVLALEIDVFKEAWPLLINKKFPRKSQKALNGSVHKKGDLESIQRIDLNEKIEPERFINLLKGLTTNNVREAAFFEHGGERYRIQITIQKDSKEKP
jgi:methionyl-tRNA formyltransferase